MKFLILKTTNPYLNLAIEEYFFSKTNEDVFMLWQNEPTVVIGKNQNAYAEVNMDYVRNKNIHVARRITGGGAVYHDFGNVNYTFISSREKTDIDFVYFTKPIIDALNNLGISAKLSGRNDLEIDNKKFSGNAQHASASRVLHHGTLLFDSNFDELSKALNVDQEKIKAKSIKSTRSRVINLKDYLPEDMSVTDFINIISDYVKKTYDVEEISLPQNEYINELQKRNSSSEWIFPESDYLSTYKITKKKRFDFGLIELYINMKYDVIKQIKITGDFFGVKDISELEEIICGKSIHELKNELLNTNVSSYILGMSREDLISLVES